MATEMVRSLTLHKYIREVPKLKDRSLTGWLFMKADQQLKIFLLFFTENDTWPFI